MPPATEPLAPVLVCTGGGVGAATLGTATGAADGCETGATGATGPATGCGGLQLGTGANATGAAAVSTGACAYLVPPVGLGEALGRSARRSAATALSRLPICDRSSSACLLSSSSFATESPGVAGLVAATVEPVAAAATELMAKAAPVTAEVVATQVSTIREGRFIGIQG